MSKFPIPVRCDATASQGYEAFYQCVTYANALQRRRRGIHFLVRPEPATVVSAIQKGGHEWRLAEHPIGTEEDLRETVGIIRQFQAAAVIVADPGLSSDYLLRLSETGVQLAVIDPQAGTQYPRCLLINPMLGPNREAYSVVPGTQMLMGQRFALVRPFVRRMRPIRAQEPPTPFRVLVAFGDDDVRGQTLERARQLLGISRVEKIDVAIRPQNPAMNDLLALKEANQDRLEVVTEPGEISLRLGRCHFALTSGDGWSLELACIGVPQLMLVQSPWHMMNAQRLDDEGAALNLGDCESVNAGQLRQAVQNLLSDPRDRQNMARYGRKLIDGRGPDRLVNGLEVMLARAQQAVEERVAA
jgi:spore coat polysaccharide biosynthesis predicted glycosyltransferase SpsG